MLLGVLIATAVLHLPGLSSKPVADDYAQRSIVMGTYPTQRTALEAYTAVEPDSGELATLVDRGALPWWSDAELSGVGLRPGASALIALDHRLGLGPTGQHVHSFVWWTLLLAAFASVARLLLPRQSALIAVVLFVLNPAHAIPIAWIANRVALVSAAFALVAVFGHLRWRMNAWRPGLAISIAGCAASLFAGEYGLGALAFLLAYELFGERGGRARGALGIGIALGAYAAVRAIAGAGTRATIMYTDPWIEPLRFAKDATARLPALIAQLVIQLPSDFGVGMLRALPVGAAATAFTLAFLFGLQRVVRRSRASELAWLVPATFFSVVPLLAVEPSPRLLVLPCAGSSLLFGHCASALLGGGALARALAGAVIFVHGIAAAFGASAQASAWRVTAERAARSIFESAANPPDASSRCFLILNSPDLVATYSAPFMLAARHGSLPRCWFVLGSSLGPLEVSRPARDTLELASRSSGVLDSPTVEFVSRRPIVPSEALLGAQPRLRPTVLERSSDGPVRVRFDARFSLQDPSITALVWHGGRLGPFALPGVGQSRSIPAP